MRDYKEKRFKNKSLRSKGWNNKKRENVKQKCKNKLKDKGCYSLKRRNNKRKGYNNSEDRDRERRSSKKGNNKKKGSLKSYKKNKVTIKSRLLSKMIANHTTRKNKNYKFNQAKQHHSTNPMSLLQIFNQTYHSVQIAKAAISKSKLSLRVALSYYLKKGNKKAMLMRNK